MARRTPYTTAGPLQHAILTARYEYTPYGEIEPATATVEDWYQFWGEEITKLELEGFGTLTVKETEGGEGQGDHAHIVFELRDADGEVTYYKIDGYYASFGDGADFSYADLYQVKPTEKTIIVYEAV